MPLRWRQTKTMLRLLSVGTALLLLPASLGFFGSGLTIDARPLDRAAHAATITRDPLTLTTLAPAAPDAAMARRDIALDATARRASAIDPTAFALVHDRFALARDLSAILPAAGTPGDQFAMKAPIWSSRDAGPSAQLDVERAGLDHCLPEDARCRAFVAGDGPKKGRFAGRLPDGTEVEISRFQAWRQLRCLAYAAWAEARSEGTEGMLAVMQLILHRVGHDEHPDTVCGVVSEPRQFDAMLSKKSRRWLAAARDRDAMVPAMPKKLTGPDAEAAEAALTLAWRLMTGQIETDLVGGATFYATVELIEKRGSDVLAPNLEETTVVGEHAFFRLIDEDDEDGASTLVAHR